MYYLFFPFSSFSFLKNVLLFLKAPYTPVHQVHVRVHVVTVYKCTIAQGASNALLYKLLVFTLLQEVSVLPRRFEF